MSTNNVLLTSGSNDSSSPAVTVAASTTAPMLASLASLDPITANIDEYLALNKYEVDETNAHIELVDNPSMEEFLKLVRVCPAALYKIDVDGKQSFDYAGCLECGTCRIACGDTIIAKWENPQPGMGVSYRYG